VALLQIEPPSVHAVQVLFPLK